VPVFDLGGDAGKAGIALMVGIASDASASCRQVIDEKPLKRAAA
jgi:hypothetical protein